MKSIILIIIGIFDILLVLRITSNDEFAKRYIQSPKALIWRKFLGEEKALILIKKIFAPIGIIVGVGLVILGFLFFLERGKWSQELLSLYSMHRIT
ncbi:MAG: hypothetical protein K0S38_246 [Candidatus Paceibacter sp.]|jgi:hypothetical protein|nr:hypothetical protein [Candidatus Paceibacter sp.]